MKIILASASPRRKEILKEHGFAFTVKKSGYKEEGSFLSPVKTVKEFSFKKAESVFNSLDEKEKEAALVIGADTVVYFNGKILGKPKDEKDAERMLKDLSGKTHLVYTGYALICKKCVKRGAVKTSVEFNDLSLSLIKEYVSTKSPLDKAGAYGVQDGYPLVKKYKGSYTNVVGLPIEKIAPLINEIING